MKRKSLLCILLVAACLTTSVACAKRDINVIDKPNNVVDHGMIVGGWTLNNDIKPLNFPKDAKDAFDRAAEEYDRMTFEPIALLGSQVVAGKNYMFLCKGTTVIYPQKTSLYTVIVYNDLGNNSEITLVNDFDYTNYVRKDSEDSSQVVPGGWYVDSEGSKGELDADVQSMFDNAISTLTGISYRPIAVLGTQVVAGTNYAILCYGNTNNDSKPEAVYLLTIYKDLGGNQKIISQAYVNLAEFNK